jgi:replication factor A1
MPLAFQVWRRKQDLYGWGAFLQVKVYFQEQNAPSKAGIKMSVTFKIKDLQTGMKRVEVEADVVEKGNPRQVQSRFKDETYNVADAVVQDETGTIKLTLWNEQIDQVNVGDKIKIENGYVTSFKGEIQLNVGKFGKLTIL